MVTRRGTNNTDKLVGTSLSDLLFGLGGNDSLFGLGGNDLLRGGSGNDRLVGAIGNDRLFGDTGHDNLIGGAGNDRLVGGGGNDTLSGGSGNDNHAGGAGNDRLIGAAGNDRLNGQAGQDILIGGAGRDIIIGGSGDDVAFGGTGDDNISGGTENDVLNGDSGNDRLSGDDGDDTLTGGTGDDVIIGGAGIDTANFSGSVDEYDKIQVGSSWLIIHARGAGTDGQDLVATDVENLAFDNAGSPVIVSFADINTVPNAVDTALDVLADETDLILPVGVDDPDGDSPLLFTVLSQPAQGSVTADGSGNLLFTTAGHFDELALGSTSVVTFDFTVTDPSGATSAPATATINVQGVNDAPTVTDVQIDAGENSSGQVLLAGDDIDSDDDQSTLTYTVEVAPQKGSLAILADGTAVFDPGSDFDDLPQGGSDVLSLTYYAVDQHGAESGRASINIVVTGENDAPTSDAVSVAIGEDAGPVDIQLLGDDPDSDDGVDSLQYIVAPVGSAFDSLAQDPGNLIDFSLFTFDPTDDYQHLGAGQSEVLNLEYVAVDRHGALSQPGTISITINGANDAPVVVDVENVDDLSALLDYDGGAGDTSVGSTITATDPDMDDVLVFSGTAVGMYGNFAIDTASGDWTYTLFETPDFSSATEGVATEQFAISVFDGTDDVLSAVDVVILL
ncbi:MAG: VCBS domain-containing protein [Alphaproteobacteria bacterium]|nr:VCBS domain-containing protein [Alphaproteobacteria bacterium]